MKWSSIAIIFGEFVLIVGVTYLLIVGSGLYNIGWPSRLASSTVTPLDASLDYSNVAFNTSDNVNIAGWYVPSVGGPTKNAVLVLPSYTADKGSIFPHVAFLAQKYNVLAIDFRHTGESGGLNAGAGALETRDALAAIDYLKKRGMEKIGVYGFSLGGSIALTLAQVSPDVACVVSEGAFSDLYAIVQEPYKPFGFLSGPLTWMTIKTAEIFFRIDLEGVSPSRVLPGTQAHLLIIHAEQDPVVPFTEAQKLGEILAPDPNYEFWYPKSNVHGEGTAEFGQRVTSFFDEHFQQ